MSGGSSTPVSQTTTTNLSKEQRQLLQLAMPNYQEFAANPPQLPSYSGVAGFDPLQTQGQNMVLGATGGQGDVVNSAAASNIRTTSGELLDPNSNPALRATIDAATRPITEQLLEKALPAIRSGAQGAGQFGGSRQAIAESAAIRDAGRNVGDTAAKISTAGYQAGLDAMLKGQALAGGAAGNLAIPGLTTSGVGDVRQALEQAMLGEQYGKDVYNAQLPLMVGKELAAASGSIPGGSTTTTATTPQASPLSQTLGAAATLGGALGGAGQGAAGLSMLLPFLSDERAKVDIEKIGSMYDGIPIYRFRYLGDDRWQIGLMAGHVEKIEGAVSEINGVKFVDYGKATQRAAEIGGVYYGGA